MPRNHDSFERHYFEDTKFDLLMTKRVSEILLICNDYDAFMLEEDGRIEERVFNEYSSLHLRFPPHFNRADSVEKALEMMKKKHFDLVITLHNSGSWDAFKINTELKKIYPNKPMVVLAPFSRKILTTYDIESNDSSSDYIFSWLGDADILVAIIKLIEDKLNSEHDVKTVGVQTIILVENSIRYYSTYLPVLYETLFAQTLHVMSEDLNDHQKNLRMRGRPKILLATDYEQALKLYNKFKDNLLGVITDVEYNRNSVPDNQAGIRFCEEIRKKSPELPVLVQSSIEKNRIAAEKLNAGFINKQSDTLLYEIETYIKKYFGFGEFEFTDPKTKKPVIKAENLIELQNAIEKVPAAILKYHAGKNDFSKWLNARTLFAVSSIFKAKTVKDFDSVNEMRSFMLNVIRNFRRNNSIGVIAKFNKDNFDEASGIVRIGQGSIGGKARGLAFMDRILKEKKKNYSYYDVVISIPQTVVLASDIFSVFMKKNDLYHTAYSDSADQIILDRFLGASLPESIIPELNKIIKGGKYPLAVRSSSLLEDSYYQPFAGIYATYMIPNNSNDDEVRLRELSDAVKCVYASTFFQGSKKYLHATKNVLEEEKMAVIIQKISGSRHGSYFYPTFSGVARSINNYPIGYEKHDISIANIAAGLGKTIVDGEVSLRFAPMFPNNIIQLSSAEYSLKYTQKHFYALDLKRNSFRPDTDESRNLLKRDIYDGAREGSFDYIVSTYDHSGNIIRDTNDFSGPKIISFSNILKRETFPLSRILTDLLETLEKSMSNPVEIEFAVNLDPANENHSFDLLQARPIVSGFEAKDINISGLDNNEAIIKSFSSLGNGVLDNIYDIIYIVPDKFDPSKTEEIAAVIKQLNKNFISENKNYILIGPGRWGTSDPWLGIPVRWEDVSQASVIVEAGQKDFIVQQSQGSHFFHNITTFGVFYFTINPFLKDGFYDLEFLASLKAEFEDNFIRHISLKKPVIVKTDGRNGHGVILKP